jgi:hypothetical protein
LRGFALKLPAIFLFERKSKMKKFLVVFLFAVTVARAQSISPLTTECSKKCSGSFTITNNGLKPLNVVLEKRGFVVDAGQPHLTELPTGVDIQIGATSAVVPIGQSHAFFFKMKCDVLPCHAQILALLSSGAHAAEGLQVTLGLPHVVYACEKKQNCRADTLKSLGYEPNQK